MLVHLMQGMLSVAVVIVIGVAETGESAVPLRSEADGPFPCAG